MQESAHAAEILGLSARENMGFQDVFFKDDAEHQLKLVQVIRKYQPDIVLANAVTDRHPDHGKGASLATNACFMSGLTKIETWQDGVQQTPWRPKFVYHYIQNNYIQPDFIVDISEFWDTKVKVLPLSVPNFMTQKVKNLPALFLPLNFCHLLNLGLGNLAIVSK